MLAAPVVFEDAGKNRLGIGRLGGILDPGALAERAHQLPRGAFHRCARSRGGLWQDHRTPLDPGAAGRDLGEEDVPRGEHPHDGFDAGKALRGEAREGLADGARAAAIDRDRLHRTTEGGGEMRGEPGPGRCPALVGEAERRIVEDIHETVA